MKKRIITGVILITMILNIMLNVNATTGTVNVTSSKTELSKGETFTITLSGKCDEGINGLEAVVGYDKNVLEVVEYGVIDSKWINLGQNTEAGVGISIMCNSTNTITNADMYFVSFKVKDTTTAGTTKLTVSGITLYSDTLNTYSEGTKEISITIKKDDIIPTTYTVSFDTNGGSTVSSQTVNGGGKAIKPSNPTKSGYTFAGWYTTQALTEEFNFNTQISSNITLYAKWTEENQGTTTQNTTTYTVSFDTNGGSTVSSQTVNEGAKAKKPSNPTKSGYTFAGWYTTQTLTTEFNFDTEINSNTTIYAKWNKQDENVSDKKLPKTGENDFIIFLGIGTVLVTIISFVGYKKYKNI